MLTIAKKKIKESNRIVCDPVKTYGKILQSKDFNYVRNGRSYTFRILLGGWGCWFAFDGAWMQTLSGLPVDAPRIAPSVFSRLKQHAFAKVLHHKLP